MRHLGETLQRIEGIIERDCRYKANAYTFIMSALEYTVSSVPQTRHVSGRELIAGIRRFAVQQFGPMAKEVFNFWGIHATEDFGHIVFNLVGEGLLSKTDEDSIEDFRNGYDFKKVFEDDYYG